MLNCSRIFLFLLNNQSSTQAWRLFIILLREVLPLILRVGFACFYSLTSNKNSSITFIKCLSGKLTSPRCIFRYFCAPLSCAKTALGIDAMIKENNVGNLSNLFFSMCPLESSQRIRRIPAYDERKNLKLSDEENVTV